jgi:hypothetical protein
MSRRAAQSGEVEITYTPRTDATREAELSVLAQVYRFVLERRKADKPAPEPDGCNDAAIVRNMEGGESCRAAPR